MATLESIASRMMRHGIDIPTIAEILEVETDPLYELRESLHIEITQDDVAEAMNRLAFRAYERGVEILREGTPSMQMGLIRLMLSSMRGLMNSRSPKEMSALVDQFKLLMETRYDEEEPIEIEETDEDAPPQ